MWVIINKPPQKEVYQPNYPRSLTFQQHKLTIHTSSYLIDAARSEGGVWENVKNGQNINENGHFSRQLITLNGSFPAKKLTAYITYERMKIDEKRQRTT
jgi:hypothetical protein